MKKVFLLFLLINSLLLPAQDFELNNGVLHLKADLSRGGAISYISKANEQRSIVNIADEGRYIQQSYYAGNGLNRQSEGQNPAWSPWTWNPVQAGDSYQHRAQIIDHSNTGDTLYVKCIPMLWDMNNKPAEAVMEQWVTLSQNIVHVHNKLSCNRTDNIYGEGILNDQELPAVYVISAFRNLYSYFGNQPFTNAPVDHPCLVNLSSGFWGRYQNDIVTENWMAFTDDALYGLGVYHPGCTNFIAGLSGKTGGEANSSSTCYLAPVKKEALLKNSVYEYDYYLIIGTLNQIRAEVYNLHNAEQVQIPAEEKLLAAVWPNPATGNVNVRATCLCNKEAKLELFNMQGQKVYSITTDLRSTYAIDLSSFAKGVYTVKLSDGENMVKEKLVVE